MKIKTLLNPISFFVILLIFLSGCGGGGSTGVDPVISSYYTATPETVATVTPTPSESSATATPTSVIYTYSTPTPQQAGGGGVSTVSDLPSGVSAFETGQTESISDSNIVSLYNKSNYTDTYTLDTSLSSSFMEDSFFSSDLSCRGSDNSEDLYSFIREDSQDLYSMYGSPYNYEKGPVASDSLNEEHEFWILNPSYNDVLITATLKASGGSCYVYVDNDSSITASQAAQVASEWDSNSYPVVVNNFGSPPDSDGTSRIYILLSPVLNGGGESTTGGFYGYFWSRDQYPVSMVPHSNERDIIYLNSALLVAGTDDDKKELYATLLHEFQHMVNYNYKGAAELTTLDEGLAMLSEMLGGYGLPNGSAYAYQAVYSFEVNPDNFSLYDWNSGGSYGMSFLFMCYLYDRFGGSCIKELVSGSDNTGFENIENVTGVDFDSLYTDWVIANIKDGTSTDSRFYYASIDMTGTFGGKYYGGYSLPGMQKESLSSGSKSLKAWGVNYMLSSGTGTFSITGSDFGGLIFE